MPRQQKRAVERAEKKAAQSVPRVVGAPAALGIPKRLNAADLDDRKTRGVLLAESIERGLVKTDVLSDERVIYWSSRDDTRAYAVTRQIRNKRGTLAPEYRCSCPDFNKNGRTDCEHIFCDRLRRKEIVIDGTISIARARSAKADRRPARKRISENGRSVRSTQREARVGFAQTLTRLVVSLQKTYDKTERGAVIRFRGGQLTPDSTRASALVYKIANGKSADEMKAVYASLIEDGHLRLKSAPHQNTITDWINDPDLTPILRRFLALTAEPFRRREIGAIVDSSKISQMSSAHSRWVDYSGDIRGRADWMKCHALVGVETMVVMAVAFSGSRGEGTADINFAKPLVQEAIRTFGLHFLLADKAYFDKTLTRWLWDEANIRAVIPVKKNVERPTAPAFFDPYFEQISWYDNRQQDFHEVYRLRPKIEGFFSALKRAAQDYCWSRGRKRQFANRDQPCTAWINEALCKFIFINLRTTALLEEETGYTVDYLIPERCFPAPAQPLLLAA